MTHIVDIERAVPPVSKEVRGVVVRIDIPPSNHPGMIRGDGPGAQSGRAALGHLYDAWGKIQDAAKVVTDKGRLAAAAQPFAERALDRASRALDTLTQQTEHLDREIAAAITPPQSDARAGEIRNYWLARAGTATKGKASLTAFTGLRAAIEEGDLVTMSAVLSAPAYLSGLTQEQQGLLRLAAARRVVPDHVARREETDTAIARVRGAIDDFSATMARSLKDWRDDDHRHLETLR
ncbi:MAG: hypothetical protein GEU87_11685 [Alphaproteobacteria bacterium]|nr:hypothetical protein [Alphaproteobacteria bacterium]